MTIIDKDMETWVCSICGHTYEWSEVCVIIRCKQCGSDINEIIPFKKVKYSGKSIFSDIYEKIIKRTGIVSEEVLKQITPREEQVLPLGIDKKILDCSIDKETNLADAHLYFEEKGEKFYLKDKKLY